MYDALSRTTSEQNLLGTFSYTYDGTTGRVASVTYPNGQTSTYSYLDNEGDNRLKTIHHKYPNTTTLSKFDYTYDTVGNVLTWRQQVDTDAVLWQYGYDAADQLVTAVEVSTDSTPQVLRRFAYAYDPAGNRTLEQIDDAVTLSTYNNVNELVSQAAGGALVFEGTLDEPAAVTIQGKAAVVTSSNTFRGAAPVTAGTNAVTIVARDASGNLRTNTYEIDVAGAGRALTYDANGNLVSKLATTLRWNARDQLVAIEDVSGAITRFVYDGRGRRTEVSGTGYTARYTYDGRRIVGEQIDTLKISYFDAVTGTDHHLASKDSSGGIRYSVGDHLGSVVRLTDSSGTKLFEGRYDPFGSLLVGASLPNYAYTGREREAGSGLYYNRARYYDPASGRFISEDPARFRSGTNLYRYANGNPIRFTDALGLDVEICNRQMHGWPAQVTRIPHPIVYSSKAKKGWGFGPAGFQLPGLPDAGMVVTEDPYDPTNKDKYSCSTISTSDCVEDCVVERARAAEANPPTTYKAGPLSIGSYQCNDWAWEIIMRCEKKCGGSN